MKREIIAVVAFFHLFICSVLSGYADEVHLSVAASMTDAFKEVDAAFIEKNKEVTMLPNFGSSGSLAKQVVQGATADLFVSANPKWMDYLATEGKMATETVRDLVTNSLVVVAPHQAAFSSLKDLDKMDRIALGSPKSVPAGQYAEQAMHAAGVYEKLATENKLIMAKDVREALLYADRGEVDAAFVYKTDALLAKKAVIIYTVPAELHDPVTYPIGLTLEGKKNNAARAFYDFLASPTAVKIFEKYGFNVVKIGGLNENH